jgi:hypothetical protein
MRTHVRYAFFAVLLISACGGAEREASDAPASGAVTPAATPSAGATLQADAASNASEVARAAGIANAIAAVPTKSDSILAANGLTVTTLEEMMYRIAKDSVASAEYARLTKR